MGTGLGRRGAEVHWRVVGNMVVAWVLTLPAAGAAAALAYAASSAFASETAGVVVVGIAAFLLSGAIYLLARRTNVTSRNVIEPPAPDPVAPMVLKEAA
jgi:PiT family inorganic phosphate transporter